MPARKGAKPFATPLEEMIKRFNPGMVYANKPYYDFMVARKGPLEGRRPYIKLEAMRTTFAGSRPRLRFTIKKGAWNKVKGADFVVALSSNNVFLGHAQKVNEHLEIILPPGRKAKSFELRGSTKKRYDRDVPISPWKFVDAGVLRAYDIRDRGNLAELIRLFDEELHEKRGEKS